MSHPYFGILLLLIFLPILLDAQEIEWLNENPEKKPLLVVLTAEAQYEQARAQLESFTSSTSMLVREGSSLEFIKHNLNAALNDSKKQFDKQRIVLLLIGDLDFFWLYSQFESDFFSAMYWLNTATEKNIQSDNFKVKTYQSETLQYVFEEALSNKKWDVDIKRIEQEYGESVNVRKHGKREKGIGLSYSLMHFFGYHREEKTPAAFHALTFNQYRILNRHWSIHTDITASSGLSKAKKTVQEQLRAQIDFNALLNREEIEIELNTVLKSHLYASANVQVHYRWELNEGFAPFVGAGLSYGFLQAIEVELDTTIVIDPSEGFGSGGLGGRFDRSEFLSRAGEDGADRDNFSGFGIPLSVGFHYRLSPSMVFNASLEYHQHIRNTDIGRSFIQYNKFQVGLIFALIGKRQTTYDYVRLKQLNIP